MRKYYDWLRLLQRIFFLMNHDFEKIAQELQVKESEQNLDKQLDQIQEFVREFDKIVNHN